MINGPYSITVRELYEAGPDNIPDPFIPGCHLIYSSPATLAYNSPGAIGFGVKRAALLIPESVMLLISPACCGRNSTILSSEEGYADRMFYLLMQETDLVTGRHLAKVSEAVREIADTAVPAPKVVVICITCADALLGTDLERVCRKAEADTGVRVVPAYMYALEREGRKPPMDAVRSTVYSLLEKGEKEPDMVNLMGFFTRVDPESELFAVLHGMGIKKINQLPEYSDLDSYSEMGRANFNLVLSPESVYAADELMKRIGLPYIEFPRLYRPDRIHAQYELLGAALGRRADDGRWYDKALRDTERFGAEFGGLTCAVGEMTNADPFELSLSLSVTGVRVKSIFANVTRDRFPFIRRLSEVSPDTKVYPGISPTMIHYEEEKGIDLTVGKDAAGYIPSARNLEWYDELQPYGFQGVSDFLRAVSDVMRSPVSAGRKGVFL